MKRDFKTGIITLVAFLLMVCNNITAGNYPFSAVISSSMSMQIHVKTNINSMVCDYSSDINDTVSYMFSPSDNKFFIGDNEVNIPVRKLDCHNPMMNSDMQGMFKSSKYPYIIVRVGNIKYDRHHPERGVIYFSLVIDGIGKNYKMDFVAGKSNSSLCISGDLSVNLADFSIKPPTKFFGMIKVDNMVDIHFLLNMRIEEQDYTSARILK